MYKNGVYYGWVYKITNQINGKYYIGKTYQTINRRWSQHQTNSRLKQTHSVVDKAIAKYGIDNFTIEPLAEYSAITKQELNTLLNQYEQEYIKQYDALVTSNNYNITKGGGSVSDQCLVPIDKYDENGTLIKEYESFVSATNDLGIPEHLYSNISQCCSGKKRSAYGFIWRYHGHPFNEFPVHAQHKENIPIDEYDENGNLLNKYNDIYDIPGSEELRVRGFIYRVCRGERSRYNGHIYRFHGEPLNKYKLPVRPLRKTA